MIRKNPFYQAPPPETASVSWSLLDSAVFWPGIGLALLCVNLLAGWHFVHDKRQAISRGWRVSEAKLLCFALIGGSPTILLARRIVRHKTRKQPFSSILIGITGMQALGLLALFYAALTAVR
jgi:uncharacterized membrane protein YsdA (DUF1294 family)